ncbi:PP2C family protein-serine/threonine phosphatase [Streptomyces sp. NPDC002795]|uniref:PP2C family protein-serine/threonine phosphatase n=1 Tax=Streptomyces sp. NPDC002795 TaxID=3364665 RepID=UPI00368F2F2F
MDTANALYVLPNGTLRPLDIGTSADRQAAHLDDLLTGPAQAWPLGLHLIAHTGTAAAPRAVNEPARIAWTRLAGGAPAPDLRGPVVITGPADLDDVLRSPSQDAVTEVTRMAGLLAQATILTGPQVSAVQLQGTRQEQCDMHAVSRDRASGRWAFALLDGIGDSDDVRVHVRRWAPELARTAARMGRPGNAIAEIRHLINTAPHRWGGMQAEAVAVVAVFEPGAPTLQVAWSGDARAYALSPRGRLTRLTRDHSEAQDKLNVGLVPDEWDHRTVLANLEYGRVGQVEVEARQVSRLLLCSDGVHHPLESRAPGLIRDLMAVATTERDAAATLVAEAVSAAMAREGEAGNATVLVAALPGARTP